MIRDVLVHVDANPAAKSSSRRLAYAISLAEALEAHLTAVVLALEPVIPPMIMGELPAGLIETQRQRMLDEAEESAAAARAVMDKAGIKHETRIVAALEAAAADTLAVHGRYADLLIVGQQEPNDPFPVRNLLIEGALFGSGRPALVVPYIGAEAFALDSVMIAWDGGAPVSRAVHDAMPMLEKAKAISLVTVERGRQEDHVAGADIARHLARHGLDVEVKHVPAGGLDVASALLAHIGDNRPDLVVMGAYGHSRLREFVLGGATRGMLSSMTAPVLMAH